MKRKPNPMTICWIIAGLILLVGGIVRWNLQGRCQDMIENQRAIATHAVELGLSLPPLRYLTDPPKPSNRGDRDGPGIKADRSPEETTETEDDDADLYFKGFFMGFKIQTPEQCAEVLDLARQAGDERLVHGLLAGIGDLLIRSQSDEEVVSWLKTAALPQDEIDIIVGSITSSYEPIANIGKWLDLAAPMAPKSILKQVPNRITEWTKADYKAAGQWLSGLDEGPIKQAAAAAYATTAAPYDPQGSAAWVETLPTGKKRREAAREIFDNWADGEPGRDDFARREGLKR